MFTPHLTRYDDSDLPQLNEKLDDFSLVWELQYESGYAVARLLWKWEALNEEVISTLDWEDKKSYTVIFYELWDDAKNKCLQSKKLMKNKAELVIVEIRKKIGNAFLYWPSQYPSIGFGVEVIKCIDKNGKIIRFKQEFPNTKVAKYRKTA